MKLIVYIAFLLSLSHLQADLIRASNDVINKAVADQKVAEGWHYTIKNNTKQDIIGFIRLEAKGGVQAPLYMTPGQSIDFYTLRGKDYDFNKDVLGQDAPISPEKVAEIFAGTAAAGTLATLAPVANAALEASAARAALQGADTMFIQETIINPNAYAKIAEMGGDVANASTKSIMASNALETTAGTAAKVGAGVAGAAVVVGATLGGVWGAEVDPTHITVWWNEASNRARKYTFILNASSNWGAILTKNHDLEFSTNRNNDLILKIDGTPLGGASVKIDTVKL